ncbi:E3 ubiquitin ligase BIG BROTHER-related isoform X1 [Amborella trichopoda]|uniref:RING-type domain-containing protein n=1 Tax=Amborella trichopoda TaxID=13333 RepID=W1PZ62_AMBTC|nr:E3 ubiquitin ligase BIG BROTHER-related isoform X1 [Amborella trichopoda]XP_020527456.1 E3 ubiquitin ligase BIG BROTHER-related isoform X1 [Amborella trichopoda]ERN13429.1 hypothetical protein AMTR_s00041p00192380 [Amborella trichopoda]|eukprot:XP_006851962.1 E3 ubiquitin ligase BIG BROTHER-related isoform X1 [Amborella trichopoda]
MENEKEGSVGEKGADETPVMDDGGSNSRPSQPSRTPFTSLSQVDADLALARTLQEQERAYMVLRMNGELHEYESSASGSYDYEEDGDDLDENGGNERDDDEDAFDVIARADAADEENEIDPSAFDSDEAYARALQDVEEREMAIHLMALTGINGWAGEEEDHEEEEDSNSQDTWQEVDPDDLSYEELIALGEVVGTETRGLSADMIASLPSSKYKAQSTAEGAIEQCVICRVDYEEGDDLTDLLCKHRYHSECINNWLKINKVCPLCSTEVSTSAVQQE